MDCDVINNTGGVGKMNKRGFTTQDFIISGLLFTSIVIFSVLGIAGLETNYPELNPIVDSEFSVNYDRLINQTTTIDTMRSTSLSGEGLTFRGLFDVTFGSFFTIMRLTFNTINLFSDIVSNVTEDFPFIDAAVANAFFLIGFAIFTVLLIFLLINAVGRNKV